MSRADDFADRVHELRVWATSRIEQCRREEMKFAALSPSKRRQGYPTIVTEAATERRALQAVLAILDEEPA